METRTRHTTRWKNCMCCNWMWCTRSSQTTIHSMWFIELWWNKNFKFSRKRNQSISMAQPTQRFDYAMPIKWRKKNLRLFHELHGNPLNLVKFHNILRICSLVTSICIKTLKYIWESYISINNAQIKATDVAIIIYCLVSAKTFVRFPIEETSISQMSIVWHFRSRRQRGLQSVFKKKDKFWKNAKLNRESKNGSRSKATYLFNRI